MAADLLCEHGCGRTRFKHFSTCCTRCVGPDGAHSADCAEKAAVFADTIVDDAPGVLAAPSVVSGGADEVLALLISLGLPTVAAQAYAPAFENEGFDSISAVKTMSSRDLDNLGVKEGHKRVILLHTASAALPCSGVENKARPATMDASRSIAGPPAKKAKLKAGAVPKLAGSGLPLDGLIVCVSGAMSMVRRTFHEYLQEHGARVVLSCTGGTTHLVTTQSEADCPTRKVLAGMDKGVHIVDEKFIQDSIAEGCIVDDTPYLLVNAGGAAAPAWPAGSRSGRGGTGAPGAALSTSTSSASGGTGVADRDMIAAARRMAPVVALTSDRSSEAAARQVMLAQKWDSKMDPTGWWISEKLDGVRGYWDGKNFYSRNGNQFPAPEWFKKGLPASPLDGELWCGRRQFRRCLSVVRNRSSGKLWEHITYLVFDAPALKQPYEERVAYIKRTVVPESAGGTCPYAAAVGIVKCEGAAHLQSELVKIDKKGGEGLMLRQVGSLYENKRSNTLRKVKSTHDEEAKVVGHEGGKGAAGFHCGALTLTTPDGRQFSCGSGLSAADRRTPPAVGTIVTFRFTELMDNGYPRFPVYVGPRIDIDWEDYCSSYTPPAKEDHAAGALKRKHSILYADEGLADILVRRIGSMPDAGVMADGEARASDGSEGGDSETDLFEHGASAARRRKAKAQSLHSARDLAASAAESRAGIAGAPLRGRLWRGASSSHLSTAATSSTSATTPAAAASSFGRSRSGALAEETGLDLETARGILAEHDRAAGAGR